MMKQKGKRAKPLPEADAPKANMKIKTQIEFTTNRNKKVIYPPPISFFRAGLCSFCRIALPDDSIRFSFTAACPKCLEKIEKFNADLRRHRREYRARFNEQKSAEAKV